MGLRELKKALDLEIPGCKEKDRHFGTHTAKRTGVGPASFNDAATELEADNRVKNVGLLQRTQALLKQLRQSGNLKGTPMEKGMRSKEKAGLFDIGSIGWGVSVRRPKVE